MISTYKTYKSILFFAALFLWTSTYAQNWQNPAEKYKEAYKKYVNLTCPVPKDSIQHFVYFSRDREAIVDHPLLTHSMFKGAQIMYSWKDLEPQKGQYDFSKGQLNNPLALMHEGYYTVPIGIAVQDGNYIGKTGADIDYNENKDKGDNSRRNIVPLLHGFAKDFLRVNYMFWANQEPYFEKDVMPCFTND